MFYILLAFSLPGTLELIFLTVMAWFGGGKEEKHFISSDIKLAVIIPAYNEAQGIIDTLDSIFACIEPPDKSDIVVVADNCTDKTARIARDYGVTVLERCDEQKRGKGYALNYAFHYLLEADCHDGYIVIDADTYTDQNIFIEFRALFAAGGSAGQAIYRVKNPEASFRTRLMNISFLAFSMLRLLGRDNAGLSVGILGNGFGLSRMTISEIPYEAFSIVEDLEYHLRLIRSGKTVKLLRNTSVWSDMPVGAEEAKSQRERWDGGRFGVYRDLIPLLLGDVLLRSRRDMIEPLFELLLLPLAFHLLLILPLFLSGSSFIIAYAIFAILVLAFHVVSAMIIGKAGFSDYKALVSVPFYVLWKLSNLNGILKMAGKGAVWKRTGR
jgi:cellulose synthase/poly-beta-1,6-N-acetylglucosamine synthase-like glycosyltransferase